MMINGTNELVMRRKIRTGFLLILIAFGLPGGLLAQKTATSASKEKKQTEVQTKSSDEQKKQSNDQSVHRSRTGESGGFDSNSQAPAPFQGRSMPRTSWEFFRNVRDNSSSKEYHFEVEKDMRSLSMSVSGMCRSGEIRIAILMPGNKDFSDVKIDEHGNLNWKNSFELNEESKEKIGVWKFRVSTNKASGIFRISIQTY
jgi:hypothetical protein